MQYQSVIFKESVVFLLYITVIMFTWNHYRKYSLTEQAEKSNIGKLIDSDPVLIAIYRFLVQKVVYHYKLLNNSNKFLIKIVNL